MKKFDLKNNINDFIGAWFIEDLQLCDDLIDFFKQENPCLVTLPIIHLIIGLSSFFKELQQSSFLFFF